MIVPVAPNYVQNTAVPCPKRTIISTVEQKGATDFNSINCPAQN
jgi:hypothetical protein